ncbi:MAG: AI-2E family transporter [Patescibacteria group bacterium]
MIQNNKLIEISFGTMLKAAILIILVASLWYLKDVLITVLLAIVIASALEPAAKWFEKYKIPRVFGVLLVYFATFFIFFLVFYFVIPPLLGEAVDFVSILPEFIENNLRSDSPLFSVFPPIPSALVDSLRNFALKIQDFIPRVTFGLVSTTSAIFGGVLNFVLMIVISFYLAVQKEGIENFLRIVTPLKHEEYIIDLWKRSQKKIGRWLQGQILLGLLVGIFVFLGLTILGVKYALLLAILSAVFEIIPVFGPVMAAIPAIAVASIQAPILGLSTLGLYVIVQQFENHLIYPLVVRKTIGVPPLLVILAIVVGGKLAGIYGIILSVPLSAVLIEFLNDLAERKRRARV